MRPLQILFIFLVLTSCSNQKAETESLKGNWWYCDSSQGGYCEISISDSTVRYLSNELFDSFPAIIKEKNNQKVVTDIGLEISLIGKDLALTKSDFKTDTLKRVKEPVRLFSEYDCNMNISKYEYKSILWHEFVIRSKNKKLECTPIVLSKIKNRSATVVTLDSTFFKTNSTIVDDLEFTFEYRPKSEYRKELIKPYALLTYNTDSSRVLVKYSENGLRNDSYNIDSFLKTDGELIINTQELHSGCLDSCTFDFYVLLEGIPSLEIKKIRLNNKKITIANSGYK